MPIPARIRGNAERHEHPERPDRPERNEQPYRHERHEQPARPERPSCILKLRRSFCAQVQYKFVCVYKCMYIYIYMYIYVYGGPPRSANGAERR